jgi:hypothetical protein
MLVLVAMQMLVTPGLFNPVATDHALVQQVESHAPKVSWVRYILPARSEVYILQDVFEPMYTDQLVSAPTKVNEIDMMSGTEQTAGIAGAYMSSLI